MNAVERAKSMIVPQQPPLSVLETRGRQQRAALHRLQLLLGSCEHRTDVCLAGARGGGESGHELRGEPELRLPGVAGQARRLRARRRTRRRVPS
jgi:hypothetical protein